MLVVIILCHKGKTFCFQITPPFFRTKDTKREKTAAKGHLSLPFFPPFPSSELYPYAEVQHVPPSFPSGSAAIALVALRTVGQLEVHGQPLAHRHADT